MIKIYFPIEINVNDKELASLQHVKQVSLNQLRVKHKFPMVYSQKDNLNILVEEIENEQEDLMIGNACFNAEDIIYIYEKTKSLNQFSIVVLIPTIKRTERIEEQAFRDLRMHGRWIDISPGELEDNFKGLKAAIAKIKALMPSYSIQVIEVN